MASLTTEYGRLQETAEEIAETWTNGNRVEAFDAIKRLKKWQLISLISILVCDRLRPHDQQIFVSRLTTEISRF